jgi:hypothetical protein
MHKDRTLDFWSTYQYDPKRSEAVKQLCSPEGISDSYYRVFHHSFKMYPRLQGLSADLLRHLFEPLGFVEPEQKNPAANWNLWEYDYSSFVDFAHSWDMSELFTSLIADMFRCKFTLEMNEHWVEQSQKLMAGHAAVHYTTLATLNTVESVKNGTSFMHQVGCLEWDEATMRDAWNFSWIKRDVILEKLHPSLKASVPT